MMPAAWTKDPGQIEVEIRMSRQVRTGSFLVLEGPDDSRFWRSRIVPGDCELVIGDGKPNVEGALARLDRGGFTGVLGIIDDDFDRLCDRCLPSPNLLATDAHDLECLLLRSPALERVLAELADPIKRVRFEEKEGRSIRAALLERGLAFGRLRWLARRRDWQLQFDKLRPEAFVERATWTLDIDRLHAAVFATGIPESREDLEAAIHSLPQADPWYLCQGHDLISLLRIGLQQVLGELKSSKGVADIAALLRAAYDKQDLRQSGMGQAIWRWESSNSPYRILASRS